MATGNPNTPTLITTGFAERIHRVVRDWETQAGGPAEPRRRGSSPIDVPVRITAVYDDYLAGYRWDFDAEETVGPLLYVAKPYDLQRSTWDGKTIDGVTYAYVSESERTADDGTPVTETLTPAYRVRVMSGETVTYDGDLLWCCLSATGLTNADDEPIELRDLNEDGRAYLSAGQAGTTLTVIKWDSTRTGKRYNGHIWTDGGSQGAAVQFRFPNDPGTAALLDANDYVLAVDCPTWDEGNACWSGTDAKYWAILTPWAAVG